MSQNESIKIGEVAKQVGVATGTLRYYESLGLLKPAFRHDNGYRYYDAQVIQQVQFIKKAQTIGFSLEDIQHIFSLRYTGSAPCQLVKNLLSEKIVQVQVQIEHLQQLQKELESYQGQWQQSQELQTKSEACKSTICHLIEGISRNDGR